MRTYVPKQSCGWSLSKERYQELRNFCLQYPRWKIEAASMLELSAMNYDGMPHSTDPGDPTAKAVERREGLIRKIQLVESCALRVHGGRWYAAIINNVCNGMSYEAIRGLHPDWLKSNHTGDFFNARRAFFLLLDREKE